ncbi:YggT family protein [Sphingomonas sinipercae]|uniref:YggT family protein n=1 Tax=Sphingomonas sinipercae TaxID=2714944 RepID=A0A6G7ZL60_9SPHN|nr:YggT family protein [Sphingomonas sinipercae]QIL01650.1 YggT family protein [Sphingomonas sinipercae]
MVAAIFDVLRLILNVVWWIIIVQVILSWLIAFNVLNTGSGGVRAFLQALDRITEPLYRPIRKVMPDFGGIDFSPLVLLLLLNVLQILLNGAERSLLTGSL